MDLNSKNEIKLWWNFDFKILTLPKLCTKPKEYFYINTWK